MVGSKIYLPLARKDWLGFFPSVVWIRCGRVLLQLSPFFMLILHPLDLFDFEVNLCFHCLPCHHSYHDEEEEHPQEEMHMHILDQVKKVVIIGATTFWVKLRELFPQIAPAAAPYSECQKS